MQNAHAALGTVRWGMNGALGVVLVAAVGFAVIAVGWVLLCEQSEAQAPWRQRLMRGWRGALLALFGLFIVVLMAGNGWGMSHLHTVRLTVARTDVKIEDNDIHDYLVEDTTGRKFLVAASLWSRLARGDRLTCRATSPLFVVMAHLSNCERGAR